MNHNPLAVQAVPVEASLSKSVRTGEKALTEQCV